MKRLEGARLATQISRSVVTIGNFDGVHLGHREIISKLVRKAKEIEGVSVVVVFHPHPRKVLFPEKNVTSIFGLDDQESILNEMGVDYLVIEPFSRDLSQLTPEQFFTNYILKPYSPKALIVGYDFAFGANRQGSHKVLEELTLQNGIELEVVKPYRVNDVIVSSTEVRKAIINGQVDLAHRFLGRPFYLKGIIEKGDQRGRTLGFPTANLSVKAETIPKTGVYVTSTRARGKTWHSVTNIGRNPTFIENLPQPKVETHILDFSEDIYGEEITVSFNKYLREEKKFSNIDELKKQIVQDIVMSREEFQKYV